MPSSTLSWVIPVLLPNLKSKPCNTALRRLVLPVHRAVHRWSPCEKPTRRCWEPTVAKLMKLYPKQSRTTYILYYYVQKLYHYNIQYVNIVLYIQYIRRPPRCKGSAKEVGMGWLWKASSCG